ncbi:hypothetical protein K0M31_019421 [Melipona bicolor]|uniref:Uncharacterized protein n=1 Tax=Melipona bicolor TaxID=60889 RepID=A0AA40KR42_9HYME|nr:hypothetical protein K0M31_019421 [Melipona bicolor]
MRVKEGRGEEEEEEETRGSRPLARRVARRSPAESPRRRGSHRLAPFFPKRDTVRLCDIFAHDVDSCKLIRLQARKSCFASRAIIRARDCPCDCPAIDSRRPRRFRSITTHPAK